MNAVRVSRGCRSARGLALCLGLVACAPSSGGGPVAPLAGAIAVSPGPAGAAPLWITLRITNPSSAGVALLNPDMGAPSPEVQWRWSRETYRVAMLRSFLFLSMSVQDDTGREVPEEIIPTWATPFVMPKIQIPPHGSFDLAIPIGDFYRLIPGRSYRIALVYGDKSLKVSAQARVTVP